MCEEDAKLGGGAGGTEHGRASVVASPSAQVGVQQVQEGLHASGVYMLATEGGVQGVLFRSSTWQTTFSSVFSLVVICIFIIRVFTLGDRFGRPWIVDTLHILWTGSAAARIAVQATI